MTLSMMIAPDDEFATNLDGVTESAARCLHIPGPDAEVEIGSCGEGTSLSLSYHSVIGRNEDENPCVHRRGSI